LLSPVGWRESSMIKRILWLAPAATLIAAFAIAAPPAQALPHGATCELTGTASFAAPGLGVKPNKTLTYSFSGSLTGCHEGTVSKAPPNLGTTSGSINATGQAKAPVGLACEGGASTGSGSGNSGSGTFNFSFTTVGAGAIVLVEGAVTGSSDPNIHPGDKAAAAL